MLKKQNVAVSIHPQDCFLKFVSGFFGRKEQKPAVYSTREASMISSNIVNSHELEPLP